jgi:macrocin-O-methyltransferase TylF-like protien
MAPDLPDDAPQVAPGGIHPERHSAKDAEAYDLARLAFERSEIELIDRLEAFPRFATKRSLARFLCRHELYRRVLEVNGAIVECGVFNGAGLFTWAQLASIYEPVNYNRRIIGFDTFEGFPDVSDRDGRAWKEGDLRGERRETLELSVAKLDAERHLGHIPLVELVQGDFLHTGPEYLQRNPHLLVSLLYLDFDLYEPTKAALEVFLPRMSRGALVCFDELNCAGFPGETEAMLEALDLTRHAIRRFPTDPWISYIEL